MANKRCGGRLKAASSELLLDAGSALLGGDLDTVVALFLGDTFGSSLAFLEEAELEWTTLFVGVGADSFVGLGVDGFQTISFDACLDEARELLFEGFFVFFFKRGHVLGNVATEDVLFVHFSVGFIVLTVLFGTREAAVVVGNVQTTIASTLHGTEDAGTSGGALETNIQQSLEGGFAFSVDFDVEVFTINFFLSDIVEFELVVDATSEEEASGVGSGVVGEAVSDTVSPEFVRVGGGEADIVGHVSGEDLASDVLVGEADNKTVLGGLVFVFVLDDQTTTGIVVGLAF